MVALLLRAIPHYLYVICLLVILAFSANIDLGPPLTAEDARTFNGAFQGHLYKISDMKTHFSKGHVPSNLNYYKALYDNNKAQLHESSPETTLTFAQYLHKQAWEGPGVVVWREQETSFSKSRLSRFKLSWLKPLWFKLKPRVQRPIYYSSFVTPESSLGKLAELKTPTEKFPSGKEAFAFWKYDEGNVQLLRMFTLARPEKNTDWNLRKLAEVIPIPLERVVAVH
ncbi:uncharacterized protein UTRI_10426_B [Ustilago trichophora]|uniref:Uncharacterized protein n=1 Tax=Ustilago trichophora TaxID=86804 RepID=A0A5C3EBG3_9BASI|nr:uncharacterized protein UTRI_10426_B [Ustilago trichophora]